MLEALGWMPSTTKTKQDKMGACSELVVGDIPKKMYFLIENRG
jgi:hypothetical protein